MAPLSEEWRSYHRGARTPVPHRLTRSARERPPWRRRWRQWRLPAWRDRAIAIAVGTFVMAALGFALAMSPWPPLTTIRHIASAPNCNAARTMGLAPAFRGEPGYYERHDADNDGVACEPWPRR